MCCRSEDWKKREIKLEQIWCEKMLHIALRAVVFKERIDTQLKQIAQRHKINLVRKIHEIKLTWLSCSVFHIANQHIYEWVFFEIAKCSVTITEFSKNGSNYDYCRFIIMNLHLHINLLNFPLMLSPAIEIVQSKICTKKQIFGKSNSRTIEIILKVETEQLDSIQSRNFRTNCTSISYTRPNWTNVQFTIKQ